MQLKRIVFVKRLARIGVAFTVFAVMLAAPASSALAYYQMPIYRLSPLSGSTLLLHPQPNITRVEIQSEPPPYYDLISGLTVEVSRSPVVGYNGTLSNDYNVDSEYVYPSDGRPGVYLTTFQNFLPQYNSPGRYYFQFSGYTSSGYFVASPIYHYDFVNPTSSVNRTGKRARAIKKCKKKYKHKRKARRRCIKRAKKLPR